MKTQYVLLSLLLATMPARAVDATATPHRLPVTDEAPLRKIFVEYSDLKDPFSVQFRKLDVLPKSKTGKLTTWCGEVNAKNGMGAYSGWSQFVAIEGLEDAPVIHIVDGPSAESNAIFVNLMCRGSKILGGV